MKPQDLERHIGTFVPNQVMAQVPRSRMDECLSGACADLNEPAQNRPTGRGR